MSSVHKRTRRGRTTYRAMWREPDGKTFALRSKTFTRAADAKRFAAEMEELHERRGYGDPAKHTFAKYLRMWLSRLEEAGRMSPHSLTTYGASVRLLCGQLGNIPVVDLTPAHFNTCYAALLKGGGVNGRPLSASTVVAVSRVASKALTDARKHWKMVAINPVTDSDRPSVPRHRKPKVLTVAEVQAVLVAARRADAGPKSDGMNEALATTLLVTGMRRGEICGLAFDQVDLTTNMVGVARTVVLEHGIPVLRDRAKTASSMRRMSIPAELVTLLWAQQKRVQELMLLWGKEYQRTPLLVFPGLAGTPMRPNALTRRFEKLMKLAGIAGRQPLHAFRHTAASMMLAEGTPLTTVRDRLGHSSGSTTLDIYGHAVGEEDRKAGDRLARLLG